MIPHANLVSFVFWKKLKTPKGHFEIIWPLRNFKHAPFVWVILKSHRNVLGLKGFAPSYFGRHNPIVIKEADYRDLSTPRFLTFWNYYSGYWKDLNPHFTVQLCKEKVLSSCLLHFYLHCWRMEGRDMSIITCLNITGKDQTSLIKLSYAWSM